MLVAPVVSFVARELATKAPRTWANGYLVFIVDATAEWPQYAKPFTPEPVEPRPVVTDARDRPTLAIDARSNTGMLMVTGQALDTTFYCLRFDASRSIVTIDMFLKSVS